MRPPGPLVNFVDSLYQRKITGERKMPPLVQRTPKAAGVVWAHSFDPSKYPLDDISNFTTLYNY